jgi:hypothetical protein
MPSETRKDLPKRDETQGDATPNAQEQERALAKANQLNSSDPSAGSAQLVTDIKALRRSFVTKHKNEQVSVRGWVAAEKLLDSKSYKGYYLRDRFGAILVVRTTSAVPEITSEVQATGIAMEDVDTSSIYLVETGRRVIGKTDDVKRARSNEIVAQINTAIVGEQWDAVAERIRALEQNESDFPQLGEIRQRLEMARLEQQKRFQTYVLIGVGVALIFLAVLAVLLLRRKPSDTVESPSPSSSTPWDGSAHSLGHDVVDDYKTVRVFKTTKVLPGSFVILQGEMESSEVVYLSDQSGNNEIDIGRDSPDARGGIRIKDPSDTLSRRQAKVNYLPKTGTFRLTNLASSESNPTIVSGRELSKGQSVDLHDGDVVIMGALHLKFRQRVSAAV